MAAPQIVSISINAAGTTVSTVWDQAVRVSSGVPTMTVGSRITAVAVQDQYVDLAADPFKKTVTATIPYQNHGGTIRAAEVATLTTPASSVLDDATGLAPNLLNTAHAVTNSATETVAFRTSGAAITWWVDNLDGTDTILGGRTDAARLQTLSYLFSTIGVLDGDTINYRNRQEHFNFVNDRSYLITIQYPPGEAWTPHRFDNTINKAFISLDTDNSGGSPARKTWKASLSVPANRQINDVQVGWGTNATSWGAQACHLVPPFTSDNAGAKLTYTRASTNRYYYDGSTLYFTLPASEDPTTGTPTISYDQANQSGFVINFAAGFRMDTYPCCVSEGRGASNTGNPLGTGDGGIQCWGFAVCGTGVGGIFRSAGSLDTGYKAFAIVGDAEIIRGNGTGICAGFANNAPNSTRNSTAFCTIQPAVDTTFPVIDGFTIERHGWLGRDGNPLEWRNAGSEPAAWAIGTTYGSNALVTFGSLVFHSLQAGNVGNSPDVTADTAFWAQLSFGTVGLLMHTTGGAKYNSLDIRNTSVRDRFGQAGLAWEITDGKSAAGAPTVASSYGVVLTNFRAIQEQTLSITTDMSFENCDIRPTRGFTGLSNPTSLTAHMLMRDSLWIMKGINGSTGIEMLDGGGAYKFQWHGYRNTFVELGTGARNVGFFYFVDGGDNFQNKVEGDHNFFVVLHHTDYTTNLSRMFYNSGFGGAATHFGNAAMRALTDNVMMNVGKPDDLVAYTFQSYAAAYPDNGNQWIMDQRDPFVNSDIGVNEDGGDFRIKTTDPLYAAGVGGFTAQQTPAAAGYVIASRVYRSRITMG